MPKKIRNKTQHATEQAKIYFKYCAISIISTFVYFFISSNIINWLNKKDVYKATDFIFFEKLPEKIIPFPSIGGFSFQWFQTLFGTTCWYNRTAEESWNRWTNLLNKFKKNTNRLNHNFLYLFYPILGLVSIFCLFFWNLFVTAWAFIKNNAGWSLILSLYSFQIALILAAIIPTLQILGLFVESFLLPFKLDHASYYLKSWGKLIIFAFLPIFLLYNVSEWTGSYIFAALSLIALFFT